MPRRRFSIGPSCAGCVFAWLASQRTRPSRLRRCRSLGQPKSTQSKLVLPPQAHRTFRCSKRKEGLKRTRREHQRPFLERIWTKHYRSMEATFSVSFLEKGDAAGEGVDRRVEKKSTGLAVQISE